MSTKNNMIALSKSSQIFIDGTLKSAPLKFNIPKDELLIDLIKELYRLQGNMEFYSQELVILDLMK